jgi:hypothetical protein
MVASGQQSQEHVEYISGRKMPIIHRHDHVIHAQAR